MRPGRVWSKCAQPTPVSQNDQMSGEVTGSRNLRGDEQSSPPRLPRPNPSGPYQRQPDGGQTDHYCAWTGSADAGRGLSAAPETRVNHRPADRPGFACGQIARSRLLAEWTWLPAPHFPSRSPVGPHIATARLQAKGRNQEQNDQSRHLRSLRQQPAIRVLAHRRSSPLPRTGRCSVRAGAGLGGLGRPTPSLPALSQALVSQNDQIDGEVTGARNLRGDDFSSPLHLPLPRLQPAGPDHGQPTVARTDHRCVWAGSAHAGRCLGAAPETRRHHRPANCPRGRLTRPRLLAGGLAVPPGTSHLASKWGADRDAAPACHGLEPGTE